MSLSARSIAAQGLVAPVFALHVALGGLVQLGGGPQFQAPPAAVARAPIRYPIPPSLRRQQLEEDEIVIAAARMLIESGLLN